MKVKVFKIEGKGNLKASASITVDDICITGFKVLDGKKGLFVSMPQKKVGDEWKDMAFPVTREKRQEVIDAILGEYNKGDSEEPLPF
jgi:stage V sporulation protein G